MRGLWLIRRKQSYWHRIGMWPEIREWVTSMHRHSCKEADRKHTSLVLLWTCFSSDLGEAFPTTFSTLSLATGCLSEDVNCPSLATGCLSFTGCLTSCILLVVLAFLSSDELATVDAALTSAAVDMGGGEGFFCSFLKKRLPEEILFFSSLSLSSFKVKRPSLFEEAWNVKYLLILRN